MYESEEVTNQTLWLVEDVEAQQTEMWASGFTSRNFIYAHKTQTTIRTGRIKILGHCGIVIKTSSGSFL